MRQFYMLKGDVAGVLGEVKYKPTDCVEQHMLKR